jgi:hypothetical protein
MPLANVNARKEDPMWIRYLAGAYPRATITRDTIEIMKAQFSGRYDDDTMLDVVKAYVEDEEFWPSVAKLRKAAVHNQLNQQWRGPLWIWHKEWAADNWTLCSGPCGELTPDVSACPFCEDMRMTA